MLLYLRQRVPDIRVEKEVPASIGFSSLSLEEVIRIVPVIALPLCLGIDFALPPIACFFQTPWDVYMPRSVGRSGLLRLGNAK